MQKFKEELKDERIKYNPKERKIKSSFCSR